MVPRERKKKLTGKGSPGGAHETINSSDEKCNGDGDTIPYKHPLSPKNSLTPKDTLTPKVQETPKDIPKDPNTPKNPETPKDTNGQDLTTGPVISTVSGTATVQAITKDSSISKEQGNSLGFMCPQHTCQSCEADADDTQETMAKAIVKLSLANKSC